MLHFHLLALIPSRGPQLENELRLLTGMEVEVVREKQQALANWQRQRQLYQKQQLIRKTNWIPFIQALLRGMAIKNTLK